MRTTQLLWGAESGNPPDPRDAALPKAQLVLAFGARSKVERPEIWNRLREYFPAASVVGCSTAGEIRGTSVLDDSLVATAIEFEHTQIRCAQVPLPSAEESAVAGRELAERLSAPDLVHVLALSEGLHVNGSELVRGLTEGLPADVAVTGGLSGDGASFERTSVGLDGVSESPAVVGIGLYGDRIRVGFGSLGGWDPFGPERRVTRSRGNVLFELDGTPALDLYEKYLGDHAAELPASGLLFPLTVRTTRDEPGVVRTILGIDKKARSLTFAGEVPEQAFARLMRANFDRLLDGAAGAARRSYEGLGTRTPDLGILISCVGRKLVLKQRIEDEVESVEQVLGRGTTLTGFYSYGEIAPFMTSAKCELHNQTMTITTLSEV